MDKASIAQRTAASFALAFPATSGRRFRTIPLSYRRVGVLAFLFDFLLIIAFGNVSSMVCHFLQRDAFGGQKFFSFVSLSCAVGYVLAMQVQALYRPATILSKRSSIQAVAMTWVTVVAALLAIAFVAKVSSEISRGASLAMFGEGLLLLPAARLWERRFLDWLIKRNGLSARRRVVLFGDAAALDRRRVEAKLGRYGYTVVGRFGPEDGTSGRRRLLPSLAAMTAFVRSEHVDEILLAFDFKDRQAIEVAMAALRSTPLPVKMLFDERMNEIAALQIEDLGPTRAIQLQNGPLTEWQQFAKRSFDCAMAAAGLVVLAPFFVVIMAAIRLETPGPVLFRQRRSGFGGRVFRIYKFRSMHTLEDAGHIKQATRDDKRVTRVGRFIRRTSIDELPQLINVLKGEMSIVGPRPHAISHDDEYSKTIATYALRHHMRPGITGWAQANGYRGETASLRMMEARVQHDLWYIANWSMVLDIKAVVLTLVRVFWPKNAY